MRIHWALAAALAASPAAALDDLTGTWSGSLTCDGATPSLFTRSKSELVIQIDDDPSGTAYVSIGDGTYRVAVIPHPDVPAKGRIAGPTCTYSPATGGRVLDLAVKAKDGSGTGTMRGTLMVVALNQPLTNLCKVKVKRVSTAIPTPIPGCPP
jgi:hypothetical protein